MSKKASVEATVSNIRRKTRRKYSAEEKMRIVLDGWRGDHTVVVLCRREGISENLYYRPAKTAGPSAGARSPSKMKNHAWWETQSEKRTGNRSKP